MGCLSVKVKEHLPARRLLGVAWLHDSMHVTAYVWRNTLWFVKGTSELSRRIDCAVHEIFGRTCGVLKVGCTPWLHVGKQWHKTNLVDIAKAGICKALG